MPATRQDTVARLVARIEENLERLVDDATAAIWADIPAYAARGGGTLREDVHDHARAHFVTLLRSLEEDRAVTPEDLPFVRERVRRRIGRISIADFIHAFQTAQQVIWDELLDLAAEDQAARTALPGVVKHVVGYFAVATTLAAEAYLEAEQLLAVAGERARRDLLEDLLEGRSPAPGPRLDAARAAGLEADTPCAVIAALPTVAVDDEHALRSAAAALARVADGALSPLTVVRQDEIVIVLAARDRDGRALASRVRDAQSLVAERGVPLAVGLSTIHNGLASVPDAYREAAGARERMLPSAGLTALPTMTAFDYLTSRADDTAPRLIPLRIDRFIAEDLERGGALIETMRAYVACDLNVKRAAEQLHVHVNTAHYRMGKIEERTGCDMRSVRDVIEIIIAVQLADAA